MTDKEFMNCFMISNIFYHKEYGRVQITGLPNLNGDVQAFCVDLIRPVLINIGDIEPSFTYKDLGNGYIK